MLETSSPKAPVAANSTPSLSSPQPQAINFVRDKDHYYSSGDTAFLVGDTLLKANNPRTVNQAIEINVVRDTPLPIGKSMQCTIGRL
jgi:hypothetical protein